jgi:hypothetical protein
VLVVSSLTLLEIIFVVEEILCVVDSADSVTVVAELDVLVNIDVSEEVTSLFTVVAVNVGNALVCRIVESV